MKNEFLLKVLGILLYGTLNHEMLCSFNIYGWNGKILLVNSFKIDYKLILIFICKVQQSIGFTT